MSATEPVPGQAREEAPPGAPRPPLVPGHAGPIHALVLGASRGVGHAIAAQLAHDPRVERLYVTARQGAASAPMAELQRAQPAKVQALACDITVEANLAALRIEIAARSPRLHLAINAAGLLHAPGLAPEKTVRQVTLENLRRSFAVNAFGPILLARELLPLLVHDAPAVFASLSARVGSIGDNRLGGWYAYRAAKAAQNQLLRSFAIELARLNRRSIVLMLHPGTVDTALSRPRGCLPQASPQAACWT